MRLYAHTNWTLRGYNRITHEAVQFTEGQIAEVTDIVGEYMLGNYPMQFCRVEDGAKAKDHRCSLMAAPPIMHREMDTPPHDTQIITKHKRGWPKGKPRKVAA